MRIYIPTLGRGPAEQLTWKTLPERVRERYKVCVVCPPREGKDFASFGIPYVACSAKGISATRQWILDNADDPRVLMLDDDLGNWSMRRSKASADQTQDIVTYTKGTDKEITDAFTEFEKLLKSKAHGSIGHRLFAQGHPPVFSNGRMLRALYYNAEIMQRAKVKFRLPVMEDFDVTIQLLKAGYEGVIYNKMVQDQKATNAPGGCSTYRTPQGQAAAAYELQRLHPECVTVVEKHLKVGSGAWEGFGTSRTDVRVNWRHAAKLGGL